MPEVLPVTNSESTMMEDSQSSVIRDKPSAMAIRGASPVIALDDEPPAVLVVDRPLPEPLSRGKVFIQYRTENLRILPVFGKGAMSVSPRVGHIHITVDDAPWHFVDASGETVIIVGLAPGIHSILFQLADPEHNVITSQTVHFEIPESSGPVPR